MRALRRIVLEEAVIGAVFLTGVFYVYYFLAIWGVMAYFEDGFMRGYVTGPEIHVEMLVSSLGLGILFAMVNHLSEAPFVRQRPLGSEPSGHPCLPGWW
jgi:hypothetical protein